MSFFLLFLLLGGGASFACSDFEKLAGRYPYDLRLRLLPAHEQVAMAAVVAERQVRGEKPPFIFLPNEDGAFFKATEEAAVWFGAAAPTESQCREVLEKKLLGHPTPTAQGRLPKDKYFKANSDDSRDPIEGMDRVRKEVLADRLARAMGVKSVIHSEAVVWNRRFGVMQDRVPTKLPPPDQVVGKIDPESLAEARAYQYLIGNWDNPIHTNYGIVRGKIIVYDHDAAFGIGIAPPRADLFLGAGMPERYPRKFVDALKRLTDEELDRVFAQGLTPVEMYYVRFRRDLMLKDLALRGEVAVMP